MSLKKKRKLNVFAIGDSHVGKTTFLTRYCSQQNFLDWDYNQSCKSSSSSMAASASVQEKVKKTNGCDIHVCYHSPNTRALLSGCSAQNSPAHGQGKYGEEMEVVFWDLAGEVKQREFLNVFTAPKFKQLDAILFFFDLTNLKTFSNIYKWLITIFQSSGHKHDQARIWSVPILLIGTKIDSIPSSYAEQIKSKLLKQLNKVFLCTTGENLLFLNANDIDVHAQKIQMMQFSLFLSAICIEKNKEFVSENENAHESYESLQLSSSHSQDKSFQYLRGSQYALKAGSNKEYQLSKNVSEKFILNRDNYKNKRMIEDDKNFVQIVMEVNSFAEHQRAMQSHIQALWQTISLVKGRFSSLFSPSLQKNNPRSHQKEEEDEISLDDSQVRRHYSSDNQA